MNKHALFCDGTSDYVIPAEPGLHETVRLRFRTAKDDAEEVWLISREEEVRMQKVSTEGCSITTKQSVSSET